MQRNEGIKEDYIIKGLGHVRLEVDKVEILHVTPYKRNTKELLGFEIDIPKPGDRFNIYAFTVGGWALARDTSVVEIELLYQGRVIRRIPVNLPRSGVVSRFPGAQENCGFSSEVGVIGMPPEYELLIQTVLQNGRRIPIGMIHVRHHPLHSTFKPRLQPLMVTAMGRSGTTLLMRLLAEHPLIIAYKSYPYEVRAGSYWMHMLKILSEPANYLQSAEQNSFINNIWWLGHHPNYRKPVINDHHMREWFGCNYPEQVAAFCQHCIEEFYLRTASQQRKTEPVYFVEKYLTSHIQWMLWDLYSGAREVFLVRDFRDMISSVLALCAKRGYASFGREDVRSDEEYITRVKSEAMGLLNSWKIRSSYSYLLRYEDLILHGEEKLKSLLEYLQLDASSSTVKKIIRMASTDTPELKEHRTSRDPRASIGRWKREMSPVFQELSYEILGDILEEFGYTKNGL